MTAGDWADTPRKDLDNDHVALPALRDIGGANGR